MIITSISRGVKVIKKTTLVMGIDKGADFNAVGFMSKDGNVLGQLPKMDNSRAWFDKFVPITEEPKAWAEGCSYRAGANRS